VLGVVAAVLLVGVAALMLLDGPARNPAPVSAAELLAEASDGDSRPKTEPTPRFATYDDITFRLPFDPPALTVLAFHQASGTKARHLTSLVPDTSAGALKQAIDAAKAATITVVAAAGLPPQSYANAEDVWTGSAIRLWRSNRTGEPDTAADIGVNPGTDVYSPITGTVLQARAYDLYGKYPDWEIHIRPDGHPELDLVLIHVDDVSVRAGDRVSAGVTRIAAVRDLSKVMYMQLASYTLNGGTHVHMQLNAVEAGGRLEELSES
jgi:murein DD-endopeptidase MepM/ murein hydrolase activator NlpD